MASRGSRPLPLDTAGLAATFFVNVTESAVEEVVEWLLTVEGSVSMVVLRGEFASLHQLPLEAISLSEAPSRRRLSEVILEPGSQEAQASTTYTVAIAAALVPLSLTALLHRLAGQGHWLKALSALLNQTVTQAAAPSIHALTVNVSRLVAVQVQQLCVR